MTLLFMDFGHARKQTLNYDCKKALFKLKESEGVPFMK